MISFNYIRNFLRFKGSKRFSSSVTTDAVVAFKVTDKFFFLLKILKPKLVGYSTTEWNCKACLYPDLISASLLGTGHRRDTLNELNKGGKLNIAVWTKKDAILHCDLPERDVLLGN